MSELKRVGDFVAPKDVTSGLELRRQLRAFEGNVSNMGDRLKFLAMPRLAPSIDGIVRDDRATLSPGQFQLFDTTGGNIETTLTKPLPGDAGKFIAAIDIAGGLSNLRLHAAAGCLLDNTDTKTVLAYFTLIFCDGVNYWKLA